MKAARSIFVIFIITFLILIFINLIFFFFNTKFINQKYLKRNYMSKFPISYLVYYFNTNDRTYKNYIAVMGDSQVAGAGTSDINLSNHNISHFLKKFNPNKNYITFSWPGGGSISILKLFKLNRDNFIYSRIDEDPKKIIYIFNESNDLTDDYNDKYLNLRNYAFSKKEYIKQIFPLFYFSYLTFYNRDFKYSKNVSNIIFFKKIIIDITSKGRVETPEIYDDKLDKAYNILYENLYSLKMRTNKLYFVFLPSPVTLYEFQSPIKSVSYNNNSIIEITKENAEIYHNTIVRNLQNLCKKLNIQFIDITEEMRTKSKDILMIGPEDYGHYNVQGNEFIAKIINSKID